ncbi:MULTISPECIES: HIT family protein [Methylobacterium]|jgi:histidine triad (HIT) family protein|uniref:HIT family protein n=1 Tax=Methylobacterium TaxID=407 RepID=UPI0008EB0D2D|nr:MULTISPECIES: HIT family protein [Methylobacterium]MBK3395500.1 HIT family protein [Methylobacterium ajmalii]MBK3408858.1 HIT family protein [Methylobacterium ajmalii]MBK3420728.1 HIT family protein [Methylobacterium ajmalii]MBZ6413757.1 HIT family protein [Methylobacterium sp.]SFF39175.1 histidine triad (HIT) family protein [Methylobacterium sp. yr596]
MTETAYDPQNIFGKILRGEVPCHKVYEDEHVVAFMDVMPQADGHTLVVPKVPSRNLLDADPATLGALYAAVQRVARAAKAAFAADGVAVYQYNEAAAGQTVFHLHVHVLPRHEGAPPRRHVEGMADPAVLAAHAERLRAALAG